MSNSYFSRNVNFPIKFLLGFVVFINTSTLFAFGLGFLPGGLHLGSVILAYLCAAAITLLVMRHARCESCPPPNAQEENWYIKWGIVAAFALFALRVFGWHVITRSDEYCVLSPNNLSDFPLHVQYIQYFAHGAQMWPQNPFKAGNSIGYPFGVDLFNATLTIAGLGVIRGIVLFGLVASAATGIALYRWGRSVGIAAFLFHGGAVGLAYLSTGDWTDYQQTVEWKSIPLSLFVTQRGFLYAFPAGFLLLYHWKSMEFSPDKPRLLPSWLECLLYATMPLFHLHTFMFLSAVQFARLFWSVDRKHTVKIVSWSVAPASALIYLLTDGFASVSHVQWLPGWLEGEHFSLFFWLKNFGAYPFCFAAFTALLLKRSRSKNPEISGRAKSALLFVGPAMAAFVACLFFKFAPWAWDNTKFFAWSTLVITPFMWDEYIAKGSQALKVSACFALFFGGFVSLWGGIDSEFKGFEIARRTEIDQVGFAVKAIPIEAVFATAQEHAHPLVMNGRRLVLGFNGHMVGHGLNVDAERVLLNSLMNGEENWHEAAKKLGADYIFWGRQEKQEWPNSKMSWASDKRRITSGEWGDIYQVEP